MSRFFWTIAASSTGLLIPLLAGAEDSESPSSSAGIIEREIEKEYEKKQLDSSKIIPPIEIDIPKSCLELSDLEKIVVFRFIFTGNDCVLKNELECLAQRYANRPISMREINCLCREIERYYEEKGYFLARVFAPSQEIENGTLLLEILEGKLGAVTVCGNQHYSADFILSYFSPLKGKTIEYKELMRALLLVNENSDLKAGVVFEKGQKAGTADLVVHVSDRFPSHLYLNTNNYGKNLTAHFRGGGRFEIGNLIGYGDTFSLSEVAGFPLNSLYFTQAKYRKPIGSTGFFAEGSYLFSQFKIDEEKFLQLNGKTIIATLKTSYALLRTRQMSLDLHCSFDYKQIGNYSFRRKLSFDRLRVFSLGAALDRYPSPQGREYGMFYFSCGIPRFLGGMGIDAPDSSRPGSGGLFFKLNIDYDRFKKASDFFLFHVHASMQASLNKLAVAEQIYIGGSDTVRGYPLSVGIGDSGYYINGELTAMLPLKKKWGDSIQAVAFLDQGGTFLYSAQHLFLWGTGIGIRFHGFWRSVISFDIGFPLNHKDLSKGAFGYLKIFLQPF